MGCGTSNAVEPSINTGELIHELQKQVNYYKNEINRAQAHLSQYENMKNQMKDFEKWKIEADQQETGLKSTLQKTEIEANEYKNLAEEWKNKAAEWKVKASELEKIKTNQHMLIKVKHPQVEIKFNEGLKTLAAKNRQEILKLTAGEVFNDSDFEYFTDKLIDPSDEVNTNQTNEPIEWLRPHEFVTNPTVGFDSISYTEINQGTLGDCWFLAALGVVCLHETVYSKIFPDRSISLYGPNYRGYFRCSFWSYGEWIDVYVDDKLPTVRKNLIYGRCKTTTNFWVPLVEKAYAKFAGSYRNLIGGQSKNGLINLTGMVNVEFEPNSFNNLPDRYLIEDDLVRRNQLFGCAAIRFSKDNAKSDDDFDGHAYTLLRKTSFQIQLKMNIIYTLRNPHGQAKEGSRYTSDHEIWTKIDNATKASVLYEEKNDTLTWMNSDAMKRYFSNLTFCFFESIKNVIDLKGRWDFAPQNTKININYYLGFKHYLVHVKTASFKNGTKSLVIFNLMQENYDRNIKLSGLSFKLMSVKTNKDQTGMKKIGSVKYETTDLTTLLTKNHSQYYFLPKGYYLICPLASITNEKNCLNYLFRIFSYDDVTVEELELSENRRKFIVSNSDSYLSIIYLRCSLCDEIIVGPYTYTTEYVVFHQACLEKLKTCESCGNELGKNTCYILPNGLKICADCNAELDKRINSAKAK